MNKNTIFALLVGGTVVVTGAGFADVARSQTTVAANPATSVVLRAIPVKNVPPSLLAWWIDPAHNEEPTAITGTRRKVAVAALAPTAASQTAIGNNPSELPTGVQSIRAVDAQKVLLVTGTEAGITKLQQTIDFLDQPLRQVEIETQLIRIAPQDAKDAFGTDFVTQNASHLAIGFVRGNPGQILSGLVVEGKAKPVSAPRVVAINNMPASLSFRDAAKFLKVFDSATQKTALRLQVNEWKFVVTPTINNDDTVTLLMSSRRGLQFIGEAEKEPLEVRKPGGLETIANVRDGDTIALSGLDSRFFATSQDEKQAPASNMLLLVTARIVRRGSETGVKTVASER